MDTNAPQQNDRLRNRRDAVLAETLIRVHRASAADTVAVYFPDGAGRLSAVAVLDTPLGFSVNPAVDADDERYASAAAYRRGRTVLMDTAAVRRVALATPVNVKHIPFDMMVASAPAATERRSYGVVTVRWAPAREIPDDALPHLAEAARDLGRSLDPLAEQGADMLAPAVPLFVEADSEPAIPVIGPGGAGGAEAGTPRRARSTSAFLYQLQKLGGGLTGAARVADVIAVAQSEVVRAFGARGIVICLAEAGRLRVVGSSGVSRDDVRAIDGIGLNSPAPETDAIRTVSPLFFSDPGELHAAYPGLDRYHDGRPRVFVPLVSNARVSGCCVISADRPVELRSEQLALLMIMLGQVGQSVERTRAFETEWATTQGMRRALLPRSLPQVHEVDMTARYAPHASPTQTASEWYDVVELPGDRMVMIIGSVGGGEIDAIGVMGQLRAGVRAYAMEGHDPADVLTRSNRLLAELDTDLQGNCCCVRLDLHNGVVTSAAAGPLAPLVIGADGRTHPAEPSALPPLGTAADTVYRQRQLVIAPGGIIALYAVGGGGAVSGEQIAERVRNAVDGRTADNLESLADRVSASMAREAGHEDDGTTLLIARYEGPHSPLGHTAHTSVQRHDVKRIHELRSFIHELMSAWGLATITEDLELLTSEVVTNALIHAHTDVDVLLREYPDRIRVEVRDNDPRPPVPAAVLDLDDADVEEAESGRGLIIVEAVAEAWGSSPAGRGKNTWFELRTPT